MKHRMLPCLLLSVGCLIASASACETLPMKPGTLSLYSPAPLPPRAGWLIEDVKRLFADNVGPELARRAAPGTPPLHLDFPPADHQGGLFNAYADAGSGCLMLPVASLLFLRDLMMATAWLETTSPGSPAVRDYLLMMRMRWPIRLDAARYQPLAALAVPDNAADDPRVKRLYGELSTSALLFLLAHEGAHVLLRHPDNQAVAPAASRGNEIEADRLALEVMKSLGHPPVGSALMFHHLALLQLEAAGAASATHPTSPERMRAIGDRLRADADAYSDHAPDPAGQRRRIAAIAGEFDTIAGILGDRDLRDTLTGIGRTMTLERLNPGRSAAPGCAHAYCGRHLGDWTLGKGLLKVEMRLAGPADAVTGQLRAWLPEDPQAAMTGDLGGRIRDGRLHVKLRLGSGESNAVFTRQPDGTLTGTHGNDGAEAGAGSFRLRSQPQPD